jgi:hypothetical protein
MQVWADVYTLPVPGCDGKTAAEIFEEAGCTTPAAPSCAACLGGPRDTFARMNEPEVRFCCCCWLYMLHRSGLAGLCGTLVLFLLHKHNMMPQEVLCCCV